MRTPPNISAQISSKFRPHQIIFFSLFTTALPHRTRTHKTEVTGPFSIVMRKPPPTFRPKYLQNFGPPSPQVLFVSLFTTALPHRTHSTSHHTVFTFHYCTLHQNVPCKYSELPQSHDSSTHFIITPLVITITSPLKSSFPQ